MNQLEVLIQKEKNASYSQRNKDLFTFYTLTLINQEQALKRFKRNLCLMLLGCIGALFLFLPSLYSLFDSYLSLISNLDTISFKNLYEINFLKYATITFGFLFALYALRRKQGPLF